MDVACMIRTARLIIIKFATVQGQRCQIFHLDFQVNQTLPPVLRPFVSNMYIYAYQFWSRTFYYKFYMFLQYIIYNQ